MPGLWSACQMCASMVSGLDDRFSFIGVLTKQKGKMLPSQKYLDDVESCVLVFLHVCLIQITRFKGKGITPSRFNSDLANKEVCIMERVQAQTIIPIAIQ